MKAEKERREQNRREIEFEYAWLLQINLNKVRCMCLYGQLSAKRVEQDLSDFYLLEYLEQLGLELSCSWFAKISHFLERISMEHIE